MHGYLVALLLAAELLVAHDVTTPFLMQDAALTRQLVTLPERIERAVVESIHLGRAGMLTASHAAALVSGEVVCSDPELAILPIDQLKPLVRQVYTRSVSWALFTTGFIDSLSAFLPLLGLDSNAQILEVCAGGGVLASVMRNRGFQWQATDSRPPHGSAVSPAYALDALSACAPQLVFWAWWSKPKRKQHELVLDEQPEDVRFVQECMTRRIACVFVSEPRGGITGSPELWGGPWRIHAATDVFSKLAQGQGQDGTHAVPVFCDVAQWSGFADRTWVILPPGTERLFDSHHAGTIPDIR